MGKNKPRTEFDEWYDEGYQDGVVSGLISGLTISLFIVGLISILVWK